MVTAYNSLVSMINSFREDQMCFQDDAEQPESDNNKTASDTISRINKLIVWPEVSSADYSII